MLEFGNVTFMKAVRPDRVSYLRLPAQAKLSAVRCIQVPAAEINDFLKTKVTVPTCGSKCIRGFCVSTCITVYENVVVRYPLPSIHHVPCVWSL